MGQHRQPPLEKVAGAISTRMAAKADWTVRALAADLQTDGITVSHDTLWRYLRSKGLSFKKTLLASETERPKLARFRARWKTHQHRLDPARLVFADETWGKTSMTRTRGWGLRGTPLLAKVPHWGQKVTVAVRVMALKKVWAQRSQRMAMRRQSLSLPNMFSTRWRWR
jgi:hypothetical protein